ncbi:RNA polymerase sigma factor [Chitinophaga filiformis]|uniref:RNA polymerase sigma factor, sigma-70 family n=1 Tax=Chitinophaga filiformis TaxID=104663 RepID=A0A1G8DRL5_CHIFI|nr:sigma-70 family RNA polymerase sigma factor [Chitinophaga filiformis]SDH60312.1 RNA polymerase sigma factor, sigma-70 family [Chitinophaga filiformis]
MLQQLTNLSDKELISRARKLKDQEAEGVLMERYSHLMVAVCLPYLNNGPGTAPEEVYPRLLQRLSASLKTQTIPKANEWIHYTIRAQQAQTEKNSPFFPSTESREQQQMENKVEKVTTNLKEQQVLAAAMEQALDKLPAEDKYFLKEFYVNNKTFTELAATKKYSVEKTRQILQQAKQKMASLLMNETYE